MAEIRDSTLDELEERLGKDTYSKDSRCLKSMYLHEFRGFHGGCIRFNFPATPLIGPNGSGKTTVIGAAGLMKDSDS